MARPEHKKAAENTWIQCSTALAVLVANLSASAYAWKLHESCKKPEYEELVTKNMQSAFAMAADASEAIKAIDNDGSNPNNENVLKWMFLKENEDLRKNSNLQIVKEIYDKIGAQNQELPTDIVGKRLDFVVYCDFGRFKEIGDGKYEDTENEATIDASVFQEAENSCKKKSKFALAFTEDPSYCEDKAPSQLQICPWFLDWMKNRAEGTAPEKGHRASTLERYIIPNLKKKIGGNLLSEIDSRSLFDKVLLHEMAHTRGSGKIDDASLFVICECGCKLTIYNQLDGEGGFFRRFKNVKYGWKRCRDLAKKGSEDPKYAPYNNADSLALAASAIRFNNHGQIVQMDGSITPVEHC